MWGRDRESSQLKRRVRSKSARYESNMFGRRGETLEASALPLQRLFHWWPSAVTLSYQHKHIRSLLHLHLGYCVCVWVFSLLIRLCCVASPQGHQSWVHPLSCCALCHPPSTALKLHFVSVSPPEPFVFHLCGNKFAFKNKNAAGVVLKGRQNTGKRRNNMIKPKQDYRKSNFVPSKKCIY